MDTFSAGVLVALKALTASEIQSSLSVKIQFYVHVRPFLYLRATKIIIYDLIKIYNIYRPMEQGRAQFSTTFSCMYSTECIT